MNLFLSFFYGFLFFLLTPNILLHLPKNGSKYTVAIVHACIFSFVILFVQEFINMYLYESINEEDQEGYTEGAKIQRGINKSNKKIKSFWDNNVRRVKKFF